ncbi:MAG: hypothetical protein HXY38_16175 [Chloroflexi bacterium]|nr:hypothetical protein [Chloroflexota bacterium]
MKKYKVVFLDWNGTLSDSKFWGHLENPQHPNSHLFPKIEKTLFGELKHLLKPWMRGETTSEDVISQISEKAELNHNIILNEFVESCKNMKLATRRFTELIKQIQNSGTKVVVATDNMDSFPRWTVPALKLNEIFDDILESHSLKAMKGDFIEDGKSLFFHDFFSKHNIQPQESILIDDSEDRDNKISDFGIEYRKIEPVIGLEPELLRIVDIYTQNKDWPKSSPNNL